MPSAVNVNLSNPITCLNRYFSLVRMSIGLDKFHCILHFLKGTRKKWSPAEKDELRRYFEDYFSGRKKKTCPSGAECKQAIEQSRENGGILHLRSWDTIKKKVNHTLCKKKVNNSLFKKRDDNSLCSLHEVESKKLHVHTRMFKEDDIHDQDYSEASGGEENGDENGNSDDGNVMLEEDEKNPPNIDRAKKEAEYAINMMECEETDKIDIVQTTGKDQLSATSTIEKEDETTQRAEKDVDHSSTPLIDDMNEINVDDPPCNRKSLDESECIFDEKFPKVFIKGISKGNANSKHNRVYDCMHACLFCFEMHTNIQSHLERKHCNEEEIKALRELKDKRAKETDEGKIKSLNKKLQSAMAMLRNKGNYLHNMKVLKQKSGELLLARRSIGTFNLDDYGPCPQCKDWINRKRALAHLQKFCPARKEEVQTQLQETQTLHKSRSQSRG